MSNWDDIGVYFQENLFQNENSAPEKLIIDKEHQKRFKDFLENFHSGTFDYIYRNQIKENFHAERYWVEFCLGHLVDFDKDLAAQLNATPLETLENFEIAATDLADRLNRPRPDDKPIKPFQVCLNYFFITCFYCQIFSHFLGSSDFHKQSFMYS